jgi:hypothetical protein
MLVIPVMMPSVVSAYSVVGEREQGTLEPVLITPIRREADPDDRRRHVASVTEHSEKPHPKPEEISKCPQR